MFKKLILAAAAITFGVLILKAQVSSRRIDTTMKVGKTGYHISCSNKRPDKNSVTVRPLGFDKEVREFSFDVQGRVTGAEVDDLNHDGFTDLVMYAYNNDSIPKGRVLGISAQGISSVSPILFPDIFEDPKLRIGYKGNDSLYLMEGQLMRLFPVYLADTVHTTKPGKLMRMIQYQVQPSDGGRSIFKPLRSYEFLKQ